ncbi:MAG: hypothetical protein LM590_10200 [Thermofilum sp.]|nr:hypothetical protein [Thermofilum sp.]
MYLLSFTDEVSGLVFEYPPITSVEDLQKYIRIDTSHPREHFSRFRVRYDLTGESFPKPGELADKVYVSGLEVRTLRMETSKPAPNGFTAGSD